MNGGGKEAGLRCASARLGAALEAALLSRGPFSKEMRQWGNTEANTHSAGRGLGTPERWKSRVGCHWLQKATSRMRLINVRMWLVILIT